VGAGFEGPVAARFQTVGWWPRVIILVGVVLTFATAPTRSATSPARAARWDPIDRAKLHFIARSSPSPDFFQGALLGNGGLGAVVTTRPDAVVVHFGHNSVWDIRVAENNRDKIGTFQEVFGRLRKLPPDRAPAEDPEFRQYLEMAEQNYRKPYPRPFPCGSVLFGFDRRKAELLGHRLNLDTGVCEVHFSFGGRPAVLELFTDMVDDRLWLRFVDGEGKPIPPPFDRVRLIPDPEAAGTMPKFSVPANAPDDMLSFRQTLPFLEPQRYDAASGHPQDKAVRLTLRVAGKLEPLGTTESQMLHKRLTPRGVFYACVTLDHGLARAMSPQAADVPPPSHTTFDEAARRSRAVWRAYWSRSGVRLADEELERVWYRNLYFLNCSVKPGAFCPGLFANWNYDGIGTSWHGDYHSNYNMQQPFWGVFSSNHLEKHEPYVELVHFLLPLSRKWAREYYQLNGAFFPHSAYPVEMSLPPYPVPTWGWQVCETPWTVQSLWWHYLYSMDREFLRRRAFVPIREATRFIAAYMRRPDAHGSSWGDDRYHIFPTVAPELHGLSPGLRLNRDCLMDLTLTKFVFKAYLEACAILDVEKEEAETVQAVREILDHFPAYPAARSLRGKVFVSVPGEDPETVQNVPNSLATVFPGEEHGLHSAPEEIQVLTNTWLNQRNEGGNDLVFLNLQAARLGVLDLEKFKRQIAYCTLPNGTCANMVLQTQGRYSDSTPYDYMVRMGIWFENFSLPVVINECLLQSYNRQLRFFPNWPEDKDASFQTLRAVGAFLVSAEMRGGRVRWIKVDSEAGGPLKLMNPWLGPVRVTRKGRASTLSGDSLVLDTEPGETIYLRQP
jgi:hypothetical protein